MPRRDAGDFDLLYEATTGRYGCVSEETLSMFMSQAEENHDKWSNPEYDRLFGYNERDKSEEEKEDIQEDAKDIS